MIEHKEWVWFILKDALITEAEECVMENILFVGLAGILALEAGENMKKIQGYNDPKHIGNTVKYHTGKPCLKIGCEKPAGTAWGQDYCFEHNVERIDRISSQLEWIIADFNKC